ncbi:hypothetical protein AB0L74_10310 [Streptomyces sp. NPDC052020]|uniref:hypothetical protein n=1 Tax=Streptomyces sp. NPDC052020 TaxID=3155677 RepID=UPI003434406B
MRTDPIPLVIEFLRHCPDIPEGVVTGSLIGRNVGETAVYVIQSGGHRVKRDRLDRFDILYDVYGTSPAEAASLAYVVREYLLEQLPGAALKGALVLNVWEVSAPSWHPDKESLEPAYTGEVALYLVADD